MKKTKFKACCVILMISEEESNRFGYAEVIDHPVIGYREEPESEHDKKLKEDNKIYYKSNEFTQNDRFIFIPEHLIEKRITLDEARDIYPELFL